VHSIIKLKFYKQMLSAGVARGSLQLREENLRLKDS